MQQRQLRLGDILDDYCPRERRLTNHAVVAMVGSDVKQTRCTTCDAEHEYKHARVPRQRPKAESAPLAPPGGGAAPKRVPAVTAGGEAQEAVSMAGASVESPADDHERAASVSSADDAADGNEAGENGADEDDREGGADSGPVHRRLIRATLPRLEGQPPPARPPSDFTIRQPAGRGQRFRPRQPRMDQPFNGHRTGGSGGGGNSMRGGSHPNTGRGTPAQRPSNRRGHGGRRPK